MSCVPVHTPPSPNVPLCKSHFRFLFLIVPPLSGTAVSQAYVTCVAWFSLVWERDELNLQYVLC